MSVTGDWQPKRPGPALDRDSVTGQTLRAGIRAPTSRETLFLIYLLRVGARTLCNCSSRERHAKHSMLHRHATGHGALP